MTRALFSLLQIFFISDIKIYQKYPSRILFSFFQIFLAVILFYFISETLGSIPILSMKYFPYVATGLSFQYFFSSIVNASSEKLHEYRDYGILEEILYSRYPAWLVILSLGFQEIFLGSLKSLTVFISITLFFQFDINVPMLLFTLFLSFFLALNLSFVASCSFLIWKRFSLLEIGGSVVTLFFSGVYFPIEVLPESIARLAFFNPLMHAIKIFRASIGIHSSTLSSNDSTHFSMAVIALVIVLLFITNLFFYRLCIKKVKTLGLSAHF